MKPNYFQAFFLQNCLFCLIIQCIPQIWMAAILDFANKPALRDSRLGIHRKLKEYNLFYMYAKFSSFGRICPKISLTAPTITHRTYLDRYNACNIDLHHVDTIPSKHEMLTQCWPNGGPLSIIPGQH